MKTIDVVAAVIINDGKILATQRGYGQWKDWWEFPGGKIEQGESPEDALKREILEELNAEIAIEKYLCTVEYDYPEFHLSMRCYICNLLSDCVELKEHEGSKWLVPDELKCVRWLPADETVIDLLSCQALFTTFLYS